MIPPETMLAKLQRAKLVSHANLSGRKSFTTALAEDKKFAAQVLAIANEKIADTTERIKAPKPNDPSRLSLTSRRAGWAELAVRASEALNPGRGVH